MSRAHAQKSSGVVVGSNQTAQAYKTVREEREVLQRSTEDRTKRNGIETIVSLSTISGAVVANQNCLAANILIEVVSAGSSLTYVNR